MQWKRKILQSTSHLPDSGQVGLYLLTGYQFFKYLISANCSFFHSLITFLWTPNMHRTLCEAEGISGEQKGQSAFPQEASILVGETDNKQ